MKWEIEKRTVWAAAISPLSGVQLLVVWLFILFSASGPHLWAQSPTAVTEDDSAYLLRIAKPIQPNDLERFKEFLVLSNQQFANLSHLHALYQDEFHRARRELLPGVIAASHASASSGRTSDKFKLHPDFYAFEEDLLQKLEMVDERFFSMIHVMLAEVQIPRMARVRDYRSRQTVFTWGIEIKEARIDLSEMVRGVGLESSALADLDPLLAEYEERLTPSYVGADRHMRQHRSELFRLMGKIRFDDDDSVLEMGSPRQMERLEQFGPMRRSITQKRFELEKQTVGVNREYLEKLVQRLPRNSAERLKGLYREIAYPLVWPDPHDPDDIHDLIQQSKVVPQELKEVVRHLWQEYRKDYDRINDEGVAQNEQIVEEVSQFQGLHDQAKARDALRRFREQRLQMNLRILTRLKELLPADNERERAAIDQHVKEIQFRTPYYARDQYPGW